MFRRIPALGKRISLLLLLLLFAGFGSGCMENAMLIKVNRDGSGQVTYRLFLSEPLLRAFAGTTATNTADPQVMEGARLATFTRMMEAIAPQLGNGVVPDTHKISTNARGWHGFEAVYLFDDIRKLRLDNINPTGASAPESSQGSSSLGGRYTFEFEAGSVATLTLVPIPDAPSGYPFDLEPTGPPTWQSLLGAELTEEVFHQLDGLRITLYLAVNGEVEESNASFPSPRKPNVFTLLDLPFDRIAAQPDAFATVQQAGPDAATLLAGLTNADVRVEEVGKTIRVRFR